MRTALVFCVAGLVACTGKIGGSAGGGQGGGFAGGAGGGGGALATDAGSATGCEVQALLNARCVSCHGAPPTQGAPISFTSLASLRALSLRDPSKTNAARSVARMREDATRMPPPPDAPATAAEVTVIAGWIAVGMPACAATDGGIEDAGTPMETSPNLIPQAELFMCSAGVSSDAPTRLRRLTRWEWTRNVGGAVTRSWTGFSFYDNPFDPSASERYSTYATDETLDEATVELFLPIVAEAGPPWAGPYTGSNRLERLRNDTSLRCMYQDDNPTAACVRHYLAEFLEYGVLFRPPTVPELDRLQAFATTVLAAEAPPDGGNEARTHSITRISTAAWLTTGAMFRSELGTADAGRTALTNWELAQQLTYAVGRRGPGATPSYVYPDYSAPEEGHLADIAGAAKDGGIRNPQTVQALFRKYAGGTDLQRFDLVQDYRLARRTRRGEYWLSDGVTGFFREWLGYSKVPEIFKEWPEATSAYDDGGTDGYRPQLSSYSNLMSGYYGDESTLVQQMEDVIARVVVGDGDVLKNLLTTRQFYLASTAYPSSYAGAVLWTGQIYGTTQAIADSRAARWVTFPVADRAGVLTHPAWLGSHGGNFEDDPSLIHRGKWVRENLLCDYIPPLSSVKVVAQVGPHAANKNARARVGEATAKAECQGCHQLMNPLGNAFEIYNHAGYLRTRDHAPDGGFQPRDGTTTLTGMPDPALNGAYKDAVELSEKLATSNHVKRCFVRHAFRYYMGRNENRTDACTLASMEQAYDSSGGSFFKMIGTLMTSDTWSTRRVPGVGE